MPSPDAMGRLIEGFVGEAGDLCEAITRDLLVIERGGSDIGARYESIARRLHTLKGGAGTLGLEDLEQLAHRLESAVLPHQTDSRPMPSSDADALLRGLDVFMFRLRAHADGRGASLDSIDEIISTSGAERPEPSGDETTERVDDAPPVEDGSWVAGGRQTWRVAPEQVIALMKEVERLRFLRLRLDDRRRALSVARSTMSAGGRGRSLREPDEILARIEVALAADGQEAADIVESLEQGVKDIGTQPIGVIVEPLHRAVRDMCRATGKEARLSIVGGETRIDRRVVESLKGPIVHLIRNAVAHGIESPAHRRARGKHEEGAIVIRVEQQGNVVFIEVGDDGAGLDLDAIRRAAIEQGAATDADIARMSPAKLAELVFLPKVSTARAVTATSGRGIGMDAVKKGVEELHGHVELQTTWGQGTRVLVTFPAGLGSSPVLVVRADDYDFGIPMLSVESIAASKPANLVTGRNEARLKYQDELLSIVDLGVILGLRHPRPIAGGRLLVIRSQRRRVALWVGEIVGDMDLAIRSLPPEVSHLPQYQGASTLAGGQLLLIMRTDWLTGGHAAEPAIDSRAPVDDSRTARAAGDQGLHP